MSVIFGIRKPNGVVATPSDIWPHEQPTLRYSASTTAVALMGEVGMGFQPHRTNERARLEVGPARDSAGTLLAIDGRIDNYEELCSELCLTKSTPDSQIALAAFSRWKGDCFSRFIGDWSIALWASDERTLYLARDHAGARTLYYEERDGCLLWSTYLDTLVAFPQARALDPEYAACYLAAYPVRELTPYKGIRAVLPAHYVTIRQDTISVRSHWDWFRSDSIRYRSAAEYDRRFLELLGTAIKCRTGPGAPILAQLSGGRDSSSIVCLSDHQRRLDNRYAQLLDTVSFYDEQERGWDERPYFTAIEEHRRKAGIHIEMSFRHRTFEPHFSEDGLYLLPGADSSAIQRERVLQAAFSSKNTACLLSGLGGDELLGGIPTSLPELAEYLTTANLFKFLSRSVAWCLVDRSPIFSMHVRVARHTWQLYHPLQTTNQTFPVWIKDRLKEICADRVRCDITVPGRWGRRASSIENGLAWWSIVENLPHHFPGILSRQEYRYPYLDRGLVEFLFAIPRDQLIAPGHSRLLMRRALKGIVPEKVLERRRKAYPTRGPMEAMLKLRVKSEALLRGSMAAEMGFIDPASLQRAIEETSEGRETSLWQTLMRAISLELWLQSLYGRTALEAPTQSPDDFLLRT
jgi:asparagine synthase (glutamine-hydrolysing)